MSNTAQLKSVVTGQLSKQELAQLSPKKQIAFMLNAKRNEIEKMLPKHLSPDRLLKVAQIAATTTPGLLECEVATLVSAIGQCAQMGLEPNTVLGHAYLVPFNTKRKDKNGRERWVKSVQVIVGYKGLIDLARRSGQIVSIAAHEVCEKDHFELIYGLEEKLEHKPELQDRGPIIGFYAVAKLVGGGHAFEFMSRQEVDEIKLGSQSGGKYGPWKDHYTEMGRKTVIRRLSKYLPLSVEFQTATALDEMAERGVDQHTDENTLDGEYIFSADDGTSPEADTAGTATTQQPDATQTDGSHSTMAGGAEQPTNYEATLTKIMKCDSLEVLDLIADDLRDLPDGIDRTKLEAACVERRSALTES